MIIWEFLVIIWDNFRQFCIKTYDATPYLKGSDEESQHMVSVRNKKNYPLIMIKYYLSSRGPKGYTIERSFFFGLSLCGRHSYEGWSGGAKVLGKLPMRASY